MSDPKYPDFHGHVVPRPSGVPPIAQPLRGFADASMTMQHGEAVADDPYPENSPPQAMTAALDAIRARVEHHYVEDTTDSATGEFVRHVNGVAMWNDIAVLLAALDRAEAVVVALEELREPHPGEYLTDTIRWCYEEDEEWPCRTERIIRAALAALDGAGE